MVYIYSGSDSAYLKRQMKQDFLNSKTALEKVEFIDYSAYDDLIQDVIADVSSPSFSAEKKIVCLDRCYFLSTSRERVRNSGEQDISTLKEYVRKPDSINDLYLLIIGTPAKKELESIADFCCVHSFGRPTDAELTSIATQYFERKKKTVDESAMTELIRRVKGDYSQLLNELNKLDSAGDRLDLQTVCALVHRPLEDNVFNLATYLVGGRTASALALYRDLRRGGNDPHYLLSILASQFKFMLEVSFLLTRKLSEPQIVDELKAKPYRVKVTKQAIGSASPQVLRGALAALFDLDFHSKVELEDLGRSLELFIADYQPRFGSRIQA